VIILQINVSILKVLVIFNGKTSEKYLRSGIDLYLKRLVHYLKLEVIELPEPKGLKKSEDHLRYEQDLLMKHLRPDDYLVLWDEKGKDYTSRQFADWMQKRMNSGVKRVVFVVGGAYGFSDEVYRRANGQLSLSKMTFSHQMIRPFILEQIYRAMTILRNEPYHND
jgi:23S rRNA (pseudouridine1915-N3)-methyltransferase